MECYIHLRNTWDLLSDGQTPYERRLGMPFNGQGIPFVAMVTLFLRKTYRDNISSEQKCCQVYSSVMYCTRGWIWKRDLVIADIKEMEQVDASELHTRRLNAKEVLTPMKGDIFKFQIADGIVKTAGGDWRQEPSTLIITSLTRRRTRNFSKKNRRTLFFKPSSRWLTQHGTMRKPKMISGLLQEISFMVTTWNPESNCRCRKKNQFLFRWSTSTLPELLTPR